MVVLIALIVFPLATRALRHVNPMPEEWGVALKSTAEYLAGAAVTGVVVIMFDETGVFDRWALKLYEIIGPAVDSVLAAFAVAVGILTLLTTMRGYFPPKR
jgi:hypothetical protein